MIPISTVGRMQNSLVVNSTNPIFMVMRDSCSVSWVRNASLSLSPPRSFSKIKQKTFDNEDWVNYHVNT